MKVAWEILKALQLRERGPVLIACPTCGRLQFDMDTVVAEIEQRLEALRRSPIEVAVLGCAVNGIGEASHADFGITGRQERGPDLRPRQAAAEGPAGRAGRRAVRRDRQVARPRRRSRSTTRKAAEGAEWLQRIEEENAGRAHARAHRQARGREGTRGGQRRHRRAVPEAGQGHAASSSTKRRRRPPAAASRVREPATARSTTSTSSSPTSTRSLEFYNGLLEPLGFTRNSEIVGERGERVVYIGGSGGASVSLRQAQSDAHATPYDRYAVGIHHLCFGARAGSWSTSAPSGCASAGPRSRAGRRSTSYTPGYYAVFFYDPDGIKLEIGTSAGARVGSAAHGAPSRPTSCRPCARTPPTPRRSRTG